MKKNACDVLIIVFGLFGFYLLINFNKFQNEFFGCLIFIGILLYIRYRITQKEKIRNNLDYPSLSSSDVKAGIVYKYKKIMSDYEIIFLNKFKELNDKYIIIPQVNLATIIEKQGGKYHSELFRNIDFGIFDKDYNLLLLIELNDKTHTSIKRKDRDLKVKKILADSQIPLLVFYTYYPNEKGYVLNRITKALENIENLNIKNRNN